MFIGLHMRAIAGAPVDGHARMWSKGCVLPCWENNQIGYLVRIYNPLKMITKNAVITKYRTENSSQQKQNTRFGKFYPPLDVKLKQGQHVFWLFFKINLCPATSMESSHLDLLNDVTEHRSILKNKHNTHYSLIFKDRPMFSHINGKLSPRPFKWYGLTHISWSLYCEVCKSVLRIYMHVSLIVIMIRSSKVDYNK